MSVPYTLSPPNLRVNAALGVQSVRLPTITSPDSGGRHVQQLGSPTMLKQPNNNWASPPPAATYTLRTRDRLRSRTYDSSFLSELQRSAGHSALHQHASPAQRSPQPPHSQLVQPHRVVSPLASARSPGRGQQLFTGLSPMHTAHQPQPPLSPSVQQHGTLFAGDAIASFRSRPGDDLTSPTRSRHHNHQPLESDESLTASMRAAAKRERLIAAYADPTGTGRTHHHPSTASSQRHTTHASPPNASYNHKPDLTSYFVPPYEVENRPTNTLLRTPADELKYVRKIARQTIGNDGFQPRGVSEKSHDLHTAENGASPYLNVASPTSNGRRNSYTSTASTDAVMGSPVSRKRDSFIIPARKKSVLEQAPPPAADGRQQHTDAMDNIAEQTADDQPTLTSNSNSTPPDATSASEPAPAAVAVAPVIPPTPQPIVLEKRFSVIEPPKTPKLITVRLKTHQSVPASQHSQLHATVQDNEPLPKAVSPMPHIAINAPDTAPTPTKAAEAAVITPPPSVTHQQIVLTISPLLMQLMEDGDDHLIAAQLVDDDEDLTAAADAVAIKIGTASDTVKLNSLEEHNRKLGMLLATRLLDRHAALSDSITSLMATSSSIDKQRLAQLVNDALVAVAAAAAAIKSKSPPTVSSPSTNGHTLLSAQSGLMSERSSNAKSRSLRTSASTAAAPSNEGSATDAMTASKRATRKRGTSTEAAPTEVDATSLNLPADDTDSIRRKAEADAVKERERRANLARVKARHEEHLQQLAAQKRAADHESDRKVVEAAARKRERDEMAKTAVSRMLLKRAQQAAEEERQKLQAEEDKQKNRISAEQAAMLYYVPTVASAAKHESSKDRRKTGGKALKEHLTASLEAPTTAIVSPVRPTSANVAPAVEVVPTPQKAPPQQLAITKQHQHDLYAEEDALQLAELDDEHEKLVAQSEHIEEAGEEGEEDGEEADMVTSLKGGKKQDNNIAQSAKDKSPASSSARVRAFYHLRTHSTIAREHLAEMQTKLAQRKVTADGNRRQHYQEQRQRIAHAHAEHEAKLQAVKMRLVEIEAQYFKNLQTSRADVDAAIKQKSEIINSQRLGLAAKNNDLDKLQQLIDGHRSNTLSTYVNSCDQNGSSAMFHAVWPGNAAAIDVLIKAGADVNIQNNRMNSVLHFACYRNHRHIIKRLLEAGASPLLCNLNRKRCFEEPETSEERAAVCQFIRDSVVQLLAEKGVTYVKQVSYEPAIAEEPADESKPFSVHVTGTHRRRNTGTGSSTGSGSHHAALTPSRRATANTSASPLLQSPSPAAATPQASPNAASNRRRTARQVSIDGNAPGSDGKPNMFSAAFQSPAAAKEILVAEMQHWARELDRWLDQKAQSRVVNQRARAKLKAAIKFSLMAVKANKLKQMIFAAKKQMDEETVAEEATGTADAQHTAEATA